MIRHRHPLDARKRSNPEAAGRTKVRLQPTSLGLSSLSSPFYNSNSSNRCHNKHSHHHSLIFRVSSLCRYDEDAMILDEAHSPSTDCWHFHLFSPLSVNGSSISPAGTTSKYLIFQAHCGYVNNLILRYIMFTREPHPDLDTTRYSALLSNWPSLTLNQSTIPCLSRPPPLPSELLPPLTNLECDVSHSH